MNRIILFTFLLSVVLPSAARQRQCFDRGWQFTLDDKMTLQHSQADEVELFVNGKSQGVRSKTAASPYHVMWRVVFEPGEVTVVARKGGAEVRRQTIRTADHPARLRLSVDYKGEHLTFITVEVVDEQSRLCPWADNPIYFESDGAQILATDNGCQTSMERFTAPQRKAFFGRCMVVVRGTGTLKARSIGLDSAEMEIF